MIIPLIQLDEDRAIQMLLEKNKIPPEIVVQQLEQRQDYMYLVSFLFCYQIYCLMDPFLISLST